MKNAQEQLRAFEAGGGMELLAEQFADGALVQRTRGKPQNPASLDAVRRLRATGMTQAQIAQELGLSPSLVNRHWKRILSEDSST